MATPVGVYTRLEHCLRLEQRVSQLAGAYAHCLRSATKPVQISWGLGVGWGGEGGQSAHQLSALMLSINHQRQQGCMVQAAAVGCA